MKALNFEGSGGEYFKIWIVNIVLILLTVGLYYPWAKVRNHRYFYGNTTLEGKNFEYHATGKQLFLGYLVAMVLFIIYVIISETSPIGGLVIIGILFVAIPWLIWRSLMFSMRMTSFSNVRFGFKGTLGQSYINFFVYPFLLLVAVYGLPIGAAVAMPMLKENSDAPSWLLYILPIIVIMAVAVAFYMYALIKKKNASYVINGSRYGQGVFSTELETKVFVKILLKTMAVSILVFGGLFLLIGAVVYGTVGVEGMMEMKNTMEDPQVVQENIGAMIPIIATVYIGMILAVMVLVSYTTARQRSYVYANTILDAHITLASTLRARDLAWVNITNFFAVVFSLGLAYPWSKVRIARLMVVNTLVDTEHGFHDYVSQKQKEESSLGEQIGDAFDVDVGLGL